MNGSLRFGTPSACAHSSSFAASFVVMIATVSAAQNKECLVKEMLFTICCKSVRRPIGDFREFLPEWS